MVNSVQNLQGGYSHPHNYSISAIRLISLVFIILCHIMQYLNIELAWWFNVGVQIFFCISGYLYGQSKKRETTEYYKNRFGKILIPYYVTFFCSNVLLWLFFRQSFSLKAFIEGTLLRSTTAGGQHLWFVPYILLCYTLTPLLHIYRDRFVKDARSWFVFAIAGVAISSIFFGLFDRYFNPAWISCYVIGYAMGTSKGYVGRRLLVVLFGLVAVVGNGIQIGIDYVKHFKFSGTLETVYSYIKNYNHVVLGVFLFLIMLAVFEHMQWGEGAKKILDISDRYSYEVYLVHQFLIIGPMTLMAITPWIVVNILVIIIGVMILAWILKQIEQPILKKFAT